MKRKVIQYNQDDKQYKEYNKKTNVFRKFISPQKKDLVNYSIKKEDNTRKFKERIEIINTQTQNLIKLKHNPIQDQKDNYLWFVYNQKLLEEKMAKDGGYTTLFITLTLNSSYHKFKTITKYNKKTKKNDLVEIYNPKTKKYEQAFEINKSYDKNNTIKKGYDLLNKSFRTIYKNFKIKKKPEKIFFSKVMEYHEDLTSHLHAIGYVKTEHLEKLIQHIKNTIKNNKLGSIYDIEVIKDIERSSAYLLKYVAKTTNPEDEKSFHLLNGWKKKNKIRVFTHSNLDLPRYIFKKVNSVLKLSKDLVDKNPISEVLENCDIVVNTKDKKTKEITTKIYSNNIYSKYKVVINRTRSVYNIKNKFSVITKKIVSNVELGSLLKHKKIKRRDIIDTIGLGIRVNHCEDFETNEKIYDYKVNDFVITDLQTNEILYNKSDFMLLDEYKYKMYLNDVVS